MGIQHEEAVPGSFQNAFAAGYLGNPDVVAGLVGAFCAQAEQLLTTSETPAQLDAGAKSLILHYANIFRGNDPDHPPIEGFNDITLPARLIADLGPYWPRRRAKYNDDSIAVFFEWLFMHMSDFCKRANGDDILLEVMAKPTIQQAVKHLMGIEERRT